MPLLLAFGLVIALAAFFGSWASFFRLPLILGYIIVGILVGPFLFHNQESIQTFNLLRDLGLSLLLFLIGLEIRIDRLQEFGKQVLKSAVAQVVACLALGAALGLLLGFGWIGSLFLGLALSFSSTVIVVKLLTEKRDFDSLYGRIAVTILLFQDLVAIVVLILLALGQHDLRHNLVTSLADILIGALVLGIVYWLHKNVLPYLFERLARNLELLFLSSLAWLFIISAALNSLGFSLEIGAFVAGLGLASLRSEHQIAARVRPLRDLFVVIFFIILGSHIISTFSLRIAFLAIAFSLLVLSIKPLSLLIALGSQGFRRRTGFMVGISLAQISEFSLVLLFLGQKSGVVNQELISSVTLALLITVAVSSYWLVWSTKIYRVLEKHLKIFESKSPILEKREINEFEDHTVLIGCDRLGWEVLKQLQKQGRKVLVVDFSPSVVKALEEAEIPCLFGDVTDPDIFAAARIEKSSLVVSTVFDHVDTEELLADIARLTSKPTVFVTSAVREEAVRFYKMGADYVIVPRILSGHQVAHLLTDQKLAEIRQGGLKEEHIEELKEGMERLDL